MNKCAVLLQSAKIEIIAGDFLNLTKKKKAVAELSVKDFPSCTKDKRDTQFQPKGFLSFMICHRLKLEKYALSQL